MIIYRISYMEGILFFMTIMILESRWTQFLELTRQSCLIWHIVAAMECFCPQCTATGPILRIVFHLVGVLATASGVVKDSSIWFSQSSLIGPQICLSAWCDSPVGLLLFSVWYQNKWTKHQRLTAIIDWRTCMLHGKCKIHWSSRVSWCLRFSPPQQIWMRV